MKSVCMTRKGVFMKKRVLSLMSIAVLLAFTLVILAGCSLLQGLVDVEGEDYETAQLKTKEEVKAVLGSNYEITVKYGSTSSDSESGDNSWTTMSTTKVANGYTFTRIINLSDETAAPTYYLFGNGFLYGYDADSNTYTSATATTESYYGGYNYVMSYVGDSIDYNTVEDTTFISRACKKYIRNASVTILGTKMGMNYVYYIDNATGLCLKYEISGGVSSSTEGSSSGTMSYTVTDLKLTGADVSAEIAKIAIVEWPTTTQLSDFGLTAIAKPTGTYNGGSITKDSGVVSVLTTSFVVDDSAAAQAICQSVFSAGANLNSDEEAAAITTLMNADTSYLSFSAYTSNGTHVSATGMSNGDDFTISLTFTK